MEKSKMEMLREILIDTIQNLKNGKVTAKDANAVTAAVQKYINSVKVQLEFYKLLGKPPAPNLLDG